MYDGIIFNKHYTLKTDKLGEWFCMWVVKGPRIVPHQCQCYVGLVYMYIYIYMGLLFNIIIPMLCFLSVPRHFDPYSPAIQTLNPLLMYRTLNTAETTRLTPV